MRLNPKLNWLCIVALIVSHPLFAQKTTPSLKPFILTGHIFNKQDDKFYLGINQKRFDSAIIMNDSFAFKGAIAGASEAYIYFKKGNQYISTGTFFLEPGVMSIVANADSMRYMYVTGSKSDQVYRALLHSKMPLLEEADNFEIAYQLFGKFYQTAKENNINVDAFRKYINNKSDENRRLQSRIDSAFVAENPNSIVTAYLLLQDSQFDPKLCQNLSFIYTNWPDSIKESFPGKRLKEDMGKAQKRLKDKTAYDFHAKSATGDSIVLSSFINQNYVLLDFWGSWCSPCRQTTPRIKELYTKYHDKKFEIISIAISDKESLWRKAIAEDGTGIWKHILDEKNAISTNFSFAGVPTFILINKSGQIAGYYSVGGDLGTEDLDALDKKLAEVL